jgi:hypothetical protein
MKQVRTENPQISGVIAENLVARTTWRPGAQALFSLLLCSLSY